MVDDKELKNNLVKDEVLVKKKRPPSKWVADVKEYQAKNNVTYKEAMMRLSQERRLAKKE